MLRVNTASTLAGLRALEADIQRVARQSLQSAAEFAVATARATQKFTDRSGELRRSILVRGARTTRDGFAVFAQAGAAHAGFVEYGTRSHVISARSMSSVLRFRVNGAVRFARYVNHPGTKPTNFMRDARDRAEGELVRFVEIGMNSATAG